MHAHAAFSQPISEIQLFHNNAIALFLWQWLSFSNKIQEMCLNGWALAVSSSVMNFHPVSDA